MTNKTQGTIVQGAFPQTLLSWHVGHTPDPQTEPRELVPATVPGAVQLDWKRAHGLSDYNYGENFKEYAWMEDVCWLYRAPLDMDPPPNGQRVHFVCKGVDYRFQIRVDGTVLHEQEGMFTPVDLDITDRLGKGAVLEVLVYPAPKSIPEPPVRDQADQSCKPAVSYGWDFHPRLIPLGIWDDAYLETRPAGHMRLAETQYELAEDLSRAELFLDVEVSETCTGTVYWKLLDPAGTVVIDSEHALEGTPVSFTTTLKNPQLWWPNGQGEQKLYSSIVQLVNKDGMVVQTIERNLGFRRMRLVMHQGQWEEPSVFPKGRSDAPITLEVNGRPVFAKGSNLVCLDIFPGTLNESRYRELLTLARDANMNILRCWGGAQVQKDPFFDICDELGIMVWQEFPLSCNNYRGTPKYLSVLDRESGSIIRRLRSHACLALWCGGNELYNKWSGMTDQSPALRLLNRNCYDLDPRTPFLPTSPVMGMAHGPYAVHDWTTGKEVLALFQSENRTAYTEFGCGAPPSVEALRKSLPAEDLFPLPQGREPDTPRARRCWRRIIEGEHLEEYFGKSGSLEELVDRAQLLQGEALRHVFEEARRQRPRCSMAINWCFNEPWPALPNLSIVEYPNVPKKSYHRIAKALRPALASARVPKLRWMGEELFSAEVWILNDSPEDIEPGHVEAVIELGDSTQTLLRWNHQRVPANTNAPGPVARLHLPNADETDRMTLTLRSPDHPERNSVYTLFYSPARHETIDWTERMLNA